MAYVPDPNDASQPTDAIIAETAQAEFRALKGKVNALVLASGTRIPVRQCVLNGLLDATAVAAFLAISGTALGVDLKATSSPAVLTWANGFNNGGAVDSQQVISNDLANEWAGLAINNTSYLSLDYIDGVATPTPLKTLAPPHYGPAYPQNRQSVLQFAGAAASTVFLDDYGNTWTAQGAAKVQTNAIKFGTGALGGAGATNALNGAADFVKSTSFNGVIFTKEGWSLRGWIEPLNALPGAGNFFRLASFVNAAGFGAELGINNAGGTIRFCYNLSSTGAANDIAALVQGTTLPVLGTYYFIELTYDALAGTYRLYVTGAQEATTASALRVCGITQAGVGAAAGGGANTFLQGYIDKFEMLPYCQHPNGTAYAVPTAAPDVTVVGYSSDWFDTVGYKMQQVTGASTVAAGTNPTFTAKNRLYLGEGDTSGVAVTTVRSYAIAGKYVAPWVTPLAAAATQISKSHNMGTDLFKARIETQCLTPDANFTVGEILGDAIGFNAQPIVLQVSRLRNTLNYTTIAGDGWDANNKTTGAITILVKASWQQRVIADRSF